MKTTFAFEESWRKLQAARRSENIEQIVDAARAFLHNASMMLLDEQHGVACNHYRTINGGICAGCGHQIEVSRESTDGSDY